MLSSSSSYDSSSSDVDSSSGSSSSDESSSRSQPAPHPPAVVRMKKLPAPSGSATPQAPAALPVAQGTVNAKAAAAFACYTATDRQPIPSGKDASFASFKADKNLYPPKKYRYVDFSLTACQMFIDVLKADFNEQRQRAEKSGRIFKRLTWSNSGELAIHFAIACDMLKLLHDNLNPKPAWDPFLKSFISFLIRESGVPTDVLDEEKYMIKFKDWKKGGTRYAHEQVSNIQFPSYAERRKKLEMYIVDGSIIDIHSTYVEDVGRVVAPRHPAPAPAVRSAAPSTSVGPVAVPSTSVGPVRLPVRTGDGAAPALFAVKSMLPAASFRMQKWDEEFSRLKGGSGNVCFPPEYVDAMPKVVDLLRRTEHYEGYRSILDAIAMSHESVQRAFEAQGGLVVLRTVQESPAVMRNELYLLGVLDKVIRIMAVVGKTMSEASRKAWLGQQEADGQQQPPLGWLRSCSVGISAAKAESWNQSVATLQHLLLGMADAAPPPFVDFVRKRDRDLDSSSNYNNKQLRVANTYSFFTEQNGVATCCCLREPPELVESVVGTAASRIAVTLTNARRRRAEELQQRWVRQVAEAAGAPVSVPVWYDPFAMLGITPVNVSDIL